MKAAMKVAQMVDKMAARKVLKSVASMVETKAAAKVVKRGAWRVA